jgi:lysophospholipase L1-like esterase
MKLYIIGDSISVHYGPPLQSCLKGIMEYSRKSGEEEALLDLDKPAGANGGDSSMVLSFLNVKAGSGGIDADVLLLNCGLHDIKTDPKTGRIQVPIGEYQSNLRAILRVVAGMRPRLVWVRTPPCDDSIHNSRSANMHRFAADCIEYNKRADAIMNDAGIPSIDLYTFTNNLGHGSDLYCDHVHFHEHVREKQAAFIAGWLTGFGAGQSHCHGAVAAGEFGKEKP